MRCWISKGKCFDIMEREELLYQLKRFLDDEAKACSMDYGCITSEYVSRMWGGRIYLEDIEVAMKEVKIFL